MLPQAGVAAPSRDLIPTELLLVPRELCEGQADPQPSMGAQPRHACFLVPFHFKSPFFPYFSQAFSRTHPQTR